MIDTLKNLSDAAPPRTYIFEGKTGKPFFLAISVWKKLMKKAGLKNFRFHDLRHTAASHLAMNGESTITIAEILGHKTLAMVKRYTHLSNTVYLSKSNVSLAGSAGSSKKDVFVGRFAGCSLLGELRRCYFYDCDDKPVQPEYTFLSTRQVFIADKKLDIGFNSCQEIKKGKN